MRSLSVFGLLLLFTLLIRLPFFPGAANGDESTFIIVGQSIVDGYLPYDLVWDNKPPLAFAAFAVAIAAFGHDIVGVRLGGAIAVAVAAFMVYLSAALVWRRSAALFAALLCVLAVSLTSNGQQVLSEHAALPALTAGAYLLLRDRQTPWTCGTAGALLAIASLVRLNLGLVAAAGAVDIVLSYGRRPATLVRCLAAYAAGGLLVVGATWLPYGLKGQTDLLWTSAVMVPLSYAQSQNPALENLAVLSRQALGLESSDDGGVVFGGRWLNAFAWLSSVAGLIVLVAGWRAWNEAERQATRRIVLLTVATGASILLSGPAHFHYLIQLMPFAALLSAALAQYFAPPLRHGVWALATVATVLSVQHVVGRYAAIVPAFFRDDQLHEGPEYAIASVLRRENPSRRPVYLLTDHLAHWLTWSYPPTRFATHPSVISKPFIVETMGTTGRRELQAIFDTAPELVVTQADKPMSDELQPLLESYLARDYVLAAQVDGRDVHRRKQLPDSPPSQPPQNRR